MKNLVRFEFHRLVRMKSLYFCFLACVVMLFLNAVLANVSADAAEEAGQAADTAFSFAKGGISSAVFGTISGIFVALYACDDSANDTIKNIYGKGYSRGNVYFSKYLASLTACLIYGVLIILLSFGVGFIFFQVGEPQGNYIVDILLQLLIVVAYHALFFMISSSIGKIGITIAINIILPMVISLLLTAGDAALNWDFKLASLWLDSGLSTLGAATVSAQGYAVTISISVCYTAIFLLLGHLLQRKKEA